MNPLNAASMKMKLSKIRSLVFCQLIARYKQQSRLQRSIRAETNPNVLTDHQTSF